MNRRHAMKLLAAIPAVMGLAALSAQLGRSEAEAATTYHGNTESKIFHQSGCRYYSCKACTRVFDSRQAAIDAGYQPCKTCNP